MKPVWAEVITIGDEILYGQTLDTNTRWIGEHLSEIGVKIIRKVSLGDQREEIIKALDEASHRADIILITGGLGPTKDDITKKALADFFGVEQVFHEGTWERIQKLFERWGRGTTCSGRFGMVGSSPTTGRSTSCRPSHRPGGTWIPPACPRS